MEETLTSLNAWLGAGSKQFGLDRVRGSFECGDWPLCGSASRRPLDSQLSMPRSVGGVRSDVS